MQAGIVVANDLDLGLDLVSGLGAAGVSTTLYLSKKTTALYILGTADTVDDLDSDDLIDEIYTRELVPASCRVRLIDFPRMRSPRSFEVTRRLSRLIQRDGLDVVHVLMGPGEIWIAVLASLIQNVPVVSTIIIPKPNIGERLPRLLLWSVSKLLTVGSDKVIVNGADQVEQVHKLYGTSLNKLSHVPLLPRTTAMKWANRSYPEESRTVLFPGKLQRRKGLEYLVKAQPLINNRVPHARIVIAGSGQDLERCRTMMKDETKFEIHERFLTSSELAAFFQRASLVALPYLSASTSGLLMTAYVFSRPVVTTNVGSLHEYVSEGLTGYLVPPADEKSLADAIVRLLLNDDLRHQMGNNARQWIDEVRSEVVRQTISVYGDAISNHGD